MGFFDKLFGASEEESESVTRPYEGLPSWALEYYYKDVKRGDDLLAGAAHERERLGKNPEHVAFANKNEWQAAKGLMDEASQAQRLIDKGRNDITPAYNTAKWNYDQAGRIANNAGLEADRRYDLAEDARFGDRYESEYTNDVVDTTLAGMRRQADREAAARGASVAGFGGMNGTRAAVADAVSSQLTGMNMAQQEATLRSDAEKYAAEMGLEEADFLRTLGQTGFETGMSRSARNAELGDKRLSAALDRSTGYQDSAKAGLDAQTLSAQAQGTWGELQRNIEERRKNANRNSWKDATSWYSDVFNSTRGLPSTQGGATHTTTPGPSPLSQALGTAATVASIWTSVGSDERGKEDIEVPEGSALDKIRGLEPYEYNYREGFGHTRDRTTGLMAQDIEKAGIKGAVSKDKNGMRRVDPYPVLATVVQAVRELDNRTRPGAGLG